MKKLIATLLTAAALVLAPQASHAASRMSDAGWVAIHTGETKAQVERDTHSRGWVHSHEGGILEKHYRTPFSSKMTRIKVLYAWGPDRHWVVTEKAWCVKGDGFNPADPMGPLDFSWTCLDHPWI